MLLHDVEPFSFTIPQQDSDFAYYIVMQFTTPITLTMHQHHPRRRSFVGFTLLWYPQA